MRQRGPRVSRFPLVPILALLWLGLPSLLRAQPVPGPGPGQPQGGPPPQVVERATPRVTGNPFVQLWRPEDYEAGPVNTCVVHHAASGYTYVGNDRGVLEYDGARWRLLPLPKAGAVLALAIDPSGRVWVASENEIARLEPDAIGLLHAVTVLGTLPLGEEGAFEQALSARNSIWFAGNQHILRFNPDGTTDTWQTNERFGSLWWMDGAAHSVVSDRDVVRLEEGGRTVKILARDSLRVPQQRSNPLTVFGAQEGRPGEWLLLTALGPVRWRPAEKTWRPLPMRPPLFRETDAVAGTFLARGMMMFAAMRGGGLIVTPTGHVERMIDRMPGVMGPRVTAATEDREGGLWVIARERISRLQLRSAFARHDAAMGARQLLRHGDHLLIAHREGVSRYLPWPGITPPAGSLRRGATALAAVGDRVFAAASGLYEIIDGGAIVHPHSNAPITAVAGLPLAQRLVAGDAQGLSLFRRDSYEWIAEGRLKNCTANIATMFNRGDGLMWGTTADGRVWRADFRTGPPLDAPVRFFGPAEGVPAAARSARISLFVLGDSLVATSAGWILRHDAASDRFVPETRIAGITSPTQIGAEAVGVNQGACWLRMGAPDRRILRVVSAGAGRFRTEELHAPAVRELAAAHIYEDASTLWIAGTDGLISVDLEWKPPVPAAAMQARIRRVVTDSGRPLWGEGLEGGKGLSLAAQQTSLRFEFSAGVQPSDYLGRPAVHYRTQLVGAEREWSSWSPEPWRDFTNLAHGRYELRLQASDRGGRTSPTTRLAFIIPAPWWQTPWAWIGYAVVIALFVLALVGIRTRTLHRRAAELEAMVAVRTEELQRTNAELARLHRLELSEKSAARLAEEEARLEVLRYQLNPHFLYNALNSIYSLALTTPPAAANMVLRLADFCRVALDRRGEENTTVGAEFDKLWNYLEIEKVRWGDSLHIAVEADEAVRRAAIPPFLLLPLVENAIKYGGATSPDELHVRVTASLAPNGDLVLTVSNSGNWVEHDAGIAVKSSGIGLANLRQRLARHHPDAHVLTIEAENGWVVVRLRISPRLTANGVSHV